MSLLLVQSIIYVSAIEWGFLLTGLKQGDIRNLILDTFNTIWNGTQPV